MQTLSCTPFAVPMIALVSGVYSAPKWHHIPAQPPRLVAVPFPSAMRVNVATQPMALAMGDPLTYFGLAGFELWDTDAATTGTPKSGEGFQAFARTIDGRDGEFDHLLPVVLVTVEWEAMPPQTRRDTLLRVTLTDSGDDEIDSAVVDGWPHAGAIADAMDSAYFASHENAPPPYSRPETMEELSAEYVAWCDDNGLPQVSADDQELLITAGYDDATTSERAKWDWNQDFIERWDAAVERDNLARTTEQESKR